MFEPGYYKTNYRALRLREMIRWHGWFKGFQMWLKTRFKPVSSYGHWMPRLWAESECKPEDLSPDFWQATRPHRADFEKLGFVQCHLSKATKMSDKISNPSLRDSGAIFYLDSTRCHFGQLIYVQTFGLKGKQTNSITISFTAVFKDRTLTCTNRSITFDSVSAGKIIRIDSYDVPVIYDRFRQELQQCPEASRSFPDLESLRQWSDGLKMKSFEDRVRRGLFVRMTEAEVRSAWAERERYPADRPPPLPRSRFRLEYWPIIVICSLVLTYQILHRHVRMPGNSIDDNIIDYQGRKFKTRVPYASYEDYKDDPNNLDTNELGRIEKTMELVKIPESFKDRNEFIHFMFFDLEFPGYGLGFLGESATTDDGSAIEVASVEIPQRNKERFVVASGRPGGELKLVDDFIFENGGTNDISRVRLEQQQLQYFDQTGRLFRKKSF